MQAHIWSEIRCEVALRCALLLYCSLPPLKSSGHSGLICCPALWNPPTSKHNFTFTSAWCADSPFVYHLLHLSSVPSKSSSTPTIHNQGLYAHSTHLPCCSTTTPSFYSSFNPMHSCTSTSFGPFSITPTFCPQSDKLPHYTHTLPIALSLPFLFTEYS